jgi:aminoglycoside phosphotransferase family enzyme/predicted kinase
MELALLIEALSNAAAYPHPVDKVEVRHTHISVVFLAGSYVYKVKKPVSLGFLDFSTLERRRHFCEEEVRLNRRLAQHVYVGIVPITRTATGVNVEGCGEVLEWAVKMERLPDEATLEKRLQQGEIGVDVVEALARKVASFHACAEGGEHVSAFGRFEMVAGNTRENFAQTASEIGTTISRTVFDRLQMLTEEALARLHPLIDSRAVRGVPRDTHGDMHLDHVYLFPQREPPDDLIIIDCIEFNERFRFADPVADMAFLAMDLAFHGRHDLARAFSEEYFRASGDEEGRRLLSFYVAYRAAVRAKVEGFELVEKEIPTAERCKALKKARAHWLLALGELEEPGRKPVLILVGGLPGTGKSTLARGLTEQAPFSLIRSDLVRKELAGISPQTSAPAPFGEGIYSEEWTERTYAECLRRAEEFLFEGKRVIVDASFGEERRRRDFLELAAWLAVPGVFILCQADPEAIRLHLSDRRGDASDADWSVYRKAAERWEEIGAFTQPVVHESLRERSPEQRLAQVVRWLNERGIQV